MYLDIEPLFSSESSHNEVFLKSWIYCRYYNGESGWVLYHCLTCLSTINVVDIFNYRRLVS